MKKMIVGFIAGFIFATAGAVYADDGLTKIEAYLRPSLPITLNGQAVTLTKPPLVYDGSTYLNLRDIAALTALPVNWNDKTQTVELGTKGAMTTMTTSATSTTPIETTYNGLRAIIINGETYFSPGDYERKFFKDGKKNGKLVWQFKNGELNIYDDNEQVKEVVDVKNNADFTIYNGESYLNVKYYPQTP